MGYLVGTVGGPPLPMVLMKGSLPLVSMFSLNMKVHHGWVVGWVWDAGPKHRRCIRASPACFEAGIVGLAEFLFGFLPDLGFGGSILWVLMLWWLGHHSCFLGNSFLGVNLGDPKNLRC